MNVFGLKYVSKVMRIIVNIYILKFFYNLVWIKMVYYRIV